MTTEEAYELFSNADLADATQASAVLDAYVELQGFIAPWVYVRMVKRGTPADVLARAASLVRDDGQLYS